MQWEEEGSGACGSQVGEEEVVLVSFVGVGVGGGRVYACFLPLSEA